MPRPSGLYIQKTAAFPGVGNVLVMARLTADQIAAKVTDGTVAFATLGKTRACRQNAASLEASVRS